MGKEERLSCRQSSNVSLCKAGLERDTSYSDVGDEILLETGAERNLVAVCESVYVCEDGCVNVNFSQYEYQPNVSK